MSRGEPSYPVYLATGTSLTGGYWTTLADGSKRFTYLVAQSLLALGHATTFATHPNPGAGIDTALLSLKSNLSLYQPQILTVEWGINDINSSMNAATFQVKYAQLLDLILETGTHRLIICCNIPWFGWVYNGVAWNLALQYNIAIATEAAARSLPLANCWTPMVLHSEYLSNPGVTYLYPESHVGDNAHPNDTGHQVIYNAIWTVLLPVLTDWRQSVVSARLGASGREDATGRYDIV
jgi:lysophospholipase L1-like esterase